MSIKDLFRGKNSAQAGNIEKPIDYTKPEAHERPVSEPEQESAPTTDSASESAKAEDIITVHNLMILDESGSMGSIYDAALTGANETIQSIRTALILIFP